MHLDEPLLREFERGGAELFGERGEREVGEAVDVLCDEEGRLGWVCEGGQEPGAHGGKGEGGKRAVRCVGLGVEAPVQRCSGRRI